MDSSKDGSVEELVEQAAAGDRAAVDALVARYLPDVHAYLRLRAGPMVLARESTADLAQSVCREVLEHVERFRYPSEAAFRRWLFTTALRKILDRKKYYLAARRDALREIHPDRPTDAQASQLWDCYQTFSSPSGKVMLREEVERVEAAFAVLSESDREIVTLAHVVGLSRAEIAEQLGKAEGAVRIQLFRAMARLAGILAGGGA